MNSPFSNGSGRLGELPAALGLVATADIGEESIAEPWPVGKARFPISFSVCPLTGHVGNESGRFESRKQKAEIEARRRKPPKATARPYTRHILGIDSGLQSPHKAIYYGVQRHLKATPKPPQGYPKAPTRLPQSLPKARARLV
jgi:hypothetical protein